MPCPAESVSWPQPPKPVSCDPVQKLAPVSASGAQGATHAAAAAATASRPACGRESASTPRLMPSAAPVACVGVTTNSEKV